MAADEKGVKANLSSLVRPVECPKLIGRIGGPMPHKENSMCTNTSDECLNLVSAPDASSRPSKRTTFLDNAVLNSEPWSGLYCEPVENSPVPVDRTDGSVRTMPPPERLAGVLRKVVKRIFRIE